MEFFKLNQLIATTNNKKKAQTTTDYRLQNEFRTPPPRVLRHGGRLRRYPAKDRGHGKLVAATRTRYRLCERTWMHVSPRYLL